ncbi:hypothetical protein SAMN05660413_02080 [Salegentibacter flavus]|uniref:DUF4381 domain-containing protein n=2 Tax=Flavobacteriaceae TaxID=49546 RepID=A0A1I5AXF6_9FLAO|nr:hypothetical protein SAMN05660413_02080 [Salegentibacter flavus]
MNLIERKYKNEKRSKLLSGIVLFLLMLIPVFSYAQQTQINAEIDTSTIKIGEQILYSIQVETDSSNLVVFPEGDSFSPLEMVESFKADTTRLEDRFRLLKEYSLTQFDSGGYVIPQQKVLINDREFFTDSMLIEVANVEVDTTRQKMYPIKPSVEIPGSFKIPSWVWWLLVILVLAGLVFYLYRIKQKKEAEKELPPYEQVILELQQLDNSSLLEKREVKEYYSQLTFSARKYLDREVYDRALESTTSELIAYLELNKNAGKLELDEKTIKDLKVILSRADLAKFANSRPDIITAKSDRSRIGDIIEEVKTSIPEPSEEEIREDEAYREARERKKKQKRVIIAAILASLVIIGAIGAFIISKGFDEVRDSLLGHPTKELLEGEWIRSEYGDPSVMITTPEVLIRKELELPEETKQMMLGSETFVYGSPVSNFYTSLTTVKFSGETDFDLEKSVDGIYTMLEQQGARNIIMKEEEFSTLSGVEGIRIFGTLEIEDPVTGRAVTNAYEILNFVENSGFEQIMVIHNEGDTYAEEITQRIIDSVEFNKEGN